MQIYINNMEYLCSNCNEMKKLAEFISVHLNDDTSRLLLAKDKWPEIDMNLAVNCIESRRKLRGKVQEWYNEPSLVFPAKLSAEQCSSSATAAYKALFAGRIAGKEGWRIVDLTGGLGVDSWFFSRKAGKVLYNEMQSGLCEAAAHNFMMLNAGNIFISCNIAEKGRIAEIAEDFNPDVIYMDPARRGEGGKKVFLIEEPVAAAMGAGIDISKPDGRLIVDIGGGTSDVALLSLSGVVCKHSIKLAGQRFDEEIIKYVRLRHGILIGEKMAEEVKKNIGTCWSFEDDRTFEVKGRNLLTDQMAVGVKLNGKDQLAFTAECVSSYSKTGEISSSDSDWVPYQKALLVGPESGNAYVIVALPPNAWKFVEETAWSGNYTATNAPEPIKFDNQEQASAADVTFINTKKDKSSITVHDEANIENRMSPTP